MKYIDKNYEFFSFKILAYVSLLLIFGGCKKDIIKLASPKIDISTISIKTLTAFDIKIDIDLGEGQIIKNTKLVFEDITVLSSPGFEKSFDLTDERTQSQTINIQTNQLNHDFAVIAVMETDKYVYSTEKKIIRLPKNEFVFTILELSQYNLIDNKIGYFVNAGQQVGIAVRFPNKFPHDTIEVKLNGTISVANTLNFNNYWFGSGYIESSGNISIPENTPPGDYEIDIFIDGNKFIANKKIRVLAGKWIEYDNQYPGEGRFKYSYFTIGDKLYLIGGNFGAVVLERSPVWEFDIKNKKWISKKDFPLPYSETSEIFPFQLQFNSEGYIVVHRKTSIELWKYNDQEDSWLKITEYPGIGRFWINGFVINNKLFLGGGNADGNCVSDFWSFDLISLRWEKLKNFNLFKYFEFDSFCIHKEKAFIFVNPSKLIEYDPLTDLWSEKAWFPGPIRFGTTLVSFQNNLFLTGGMISGNNWNYIGLNDCFQYNPGIDSWSMKAFLPCYSNRGISFVYDDKIICGLGYITSGAKFTDHSLYQFIP